MAFFLNNWNLYIYLWREDGKDGFLPLLWHPKFKLSEQGNDWIPVIKIIIIVIIVMIVIIVLLIILLIIILMTILIIKIIIILII